MKLFPETKDITEYLTASKIIDYDNKEIQALAKHLSDGITDDILITKAAYQFVRDKISHSFDINSKNVTCKASDVLRCGEGICYAKSHLLAAILRYLGIPTGFCYQQLILDDANKPWLVLHGLNAIYINSIGKWIRVDARGNKDGVRAEFCIDKEQLAFTIRKEIGEVDYSTIFIDPNPNVILSLTQSKYCEELADNLPTCL